MSNKENNSIIKAKHFYAKSSARKLRILAKLMLGKKVEEVLLILNFINTKSAFLLKKVLYSAVANAKNNNNIQEVNRLLINKLIVNEGPKTKKFLPRAKGRTDYIAKKTSHIIIELTINNIIMQKAAKSEGEIYGTKSKS